MPVTRRTVPPPPPGAETLVRLACHAPVQPTATVAAELSAKESRKKGSAPPLLMPSWPMEPSDDMPEQQSQPGAGLCSSGGSIKPTLSDELDGGRTAECGSKSFAEALEPALQSSTTGPGPSGTGSDSSAGCRSCRIGLLSCAATPSPAPFVAVPNSRCHQTAAWRAKVVTTTRTASCCDAAHSRTHVASPPAVGGRHVVVEGQRRSSASERTSPKMNPSCSPRSRLALRAAARRSSAGEGAAPALRAWVAASKATSAVRRPGISQRTAPKTPPHSRAARD